MLKTIKIIRKHKKGIFHFLPPKDPFIFNIFYKESPQSKVQNRSIFTVLKGDR